MPIVPVTGLPGMRLGPQTGYRQIFFQPYFNSDLAQGKIIDGTKSRDPGNTNDIDVLRAGLLMGKVTATGKYAPSFFGTLTVAFTTPGTSMTVSAATATELVRRIGASGTFTLTGPPTANGTNAVTTVTYSAVNTTTGVITVTDPGVSKVVGSLLGDTDGSQTPITFIDENYGLKVTDSTGASTDVGFPLFAIAGVVISANLLPVWPTDTSIQAFIRTNLSTSSGGKFVFSDQY